MTSPMKQQPNSQRAIGGVISRPKHKKHKKQQKKNPVSTNPNEE
jgi:hypothetical protein